MQTNPHTGRNIRRIKIIPAIKSIQLAKSFNNPIPAFIKRIIPKISKIIEGNFVPATNKRITPPMKSISPKALTNMFFKPICCLKT